eukprot:CAMPEP_0197065898 /NCGR_PEP_ID=MMETSP1384-20130603/169985_1 /TAXON_ID=29189 /ORGANISM="Ammonia sp." /LENGTH=636 /DNA_ID=CAMNT_0042502883 /DNA_START=83 /DNA_END=1993 /DNA_ORIENTATION=-
MPQEDFPGLDVQPCYNILGLLQKKDKKYSMDELNKMQAQFWDILQKELDKINRGYTEREELCCKRFQMFDFRTFIISQHNNMSVCRLFQEALREVYHHFETAQMSSVLNNTPKTEKNNENLFYYAQYHSFCELLRDVHLLRDFTIQTFQIISRIIGELKHAVNERLVEVRGEGSSNEDEMRVIDRRFRELCNIELYTSPILAKLATRTEVIATSLLCAQNACAPQQTAFVCFNCHLLSKDMYVLRCFHRFCAQCVEHLKSKNSFDCPTCNRHDALTALEKDEPLRSFISTHFGANLLKQQEDAEQSHSNNGSNSNSHSNNALQPPSATNNGTVIKPEPKDNALIPNQGMEYYNQQIPAYLIPNTHLKTEDEANTTPVKRGRGRPRGRGRGRPRGGGKASSRGANDGESGGRGRGRARVTSANSLHAARSKIKNGGRAKTSCHQCKNNKDPSELLFCKNVKWGPGKKKGNMVLKHCRKKFCAQCMGKYETIERVDELFRLQEDGQLTEWQCPACADTCECAACWRKRHPNSGANIPKPTPNGNGSVPGTPQNGQSAPQTPQHSATSSQSQTVEMTPQQQQATPQQHPPQMQMAQMQVPQQPPPPLPPMNIIAMTAAVNTNDNSNNAGFSMSNMPPNI